MTAEEFEKYKGKRTFGFVGSKIIDGCIVIGYDSIRNGTLIVGCYDSRGWLCLLPTDIIDENLKRQFESFLYVNVKNLKIEKDLDLTKMLRGCEGVKLFSEVFGVGEIHKVDDFVCVKSKKGYLHYFNPNGRLTHYPDGNCLLWPSETNRDWSTFKKPVKVLDDDWVACTDGNGVYTVIKYGNISENWEYIIPYDKFRLDLTEEELKKLSIV